MSSISTLQTIGTMNTHNASLADTHLRLETGKKTNPTDENPADTAKASRLRSDINSLTSLVTELNDRYTLLSVAEQGISNQQSTLNNVKAKIESSTNPTYSFEEKQVLAREAVNLIGQIDFIANNTKYNGQQLLSGNFSDSKFSVSQESYNHAELKIPSLDTSDIVNTRFETGAKVSDPSVISLRFNVGENTIVELPQVIISSSSGTGLGKLAEVINQNSNDLGFTASYTVTTTGEGGIRTGAIDELEINGTQVGSIELTSAEQYPSLVELINQKTNSTGVTASLKGDKLHLSSADGRGIRVRSGGGIELLNLAEGGEENYGKLTLANHKGEASHIINPNDIGFNRVDSKTIGFDYFADGVFTTEDKKAIGLEDETIFSDGTIDLTNDIFASHLIKITESATEKLVDVKKHIQFLQEQIQNSKDYTLSSKITSRENLANIEDINYSDEIYNQNKFEQLAKGALYSFNSALANDKKVHEIIFESLRDQ